MIEAKKRALAGVTHMKKWVSGKYVEDDENNPSHIHVHAHGMMNTALCACGSPKCKYCNPNLWLSMPETAEQTALIKKLQARILELEADNERLQILYQLTSDAVARLENVLKEDLEEEIAALKDLIKLLEELRTEEQ